MKCNHTAVRFDWEKRKTTFSGGIPGRISSTLCYLVRPAGFEPVAYRVGVCRAIQLRYGRIIFAVFLTTKAIIPHPFGNCKSFLHFFWIHFLTAKTEAEKHNKTIPAFGLLAKSGKKCYTEKIELSYFGGEEPCYVQAVPHDAAIYENQRSA